MSGESMGTKKRRWASIQLGTEQDHKMKERFKNKIEKNRRKNLNTHTHKNNGKEPTLFSARFRFLKGWALLLLTQGIGFP